MNCKENFRVSLIQAGWKVLSRRNLTKQSTFHIYNLYNFLQNKKMLDRVQIKDIFNHTHSHRPSMAAASVARARLIMFRDAEPVAAMIRITLLHRQTMQMDGKTPRNAPHAGAQSVCHYLNGSTPQTSSGWWFSSTEAMASPTEGQMQMMPSWRAPSPEWERLGCPVELRRKDLNFMFLCGDQTPQLTRPCLMTQILWAHSRADAHVCLAQEALLANTDVELRRVNPVTSETSYLFLTRSVVI